MALRSDSGTSIRTPGVAKPLQQLAVTRLVEPAPQRLGEHGTDLVRRLKLFQRGADQRIDRPEGPRQHLRAALADVTDAESVDQRATGRSSCCARSRRRPSPRSCRRTVARSSCRRCAPRCWSGQRSASPSGGRHPRSRERVRSRSAARPAIRRGPRCSSRRVRRSVRARAAALPGTRRSRSARPPLLPRGAGRCRTPDTSSASPTARESAGRLLSTGPTTRGMTSPAFSTMTVSPARMSLRAMSSALWSVAIETVVPPTKIGSSTANGVTAPVRPTLTAISFSSVVFCSAGNLNATAQRGNLLVVPSLRRRSSASTLMTTPSVSKPRPRRLSAHSAQNATSASMPLQRFQCGSTGSPHCFNRSSVSACDCRPDRLLGDELIGERTQPTLRHQRRIEISQRAGGGVARVREQQLAGLRAFPVHLLEGRPREIDLTPDLDATRHVLSKPERDRADRADVARHLLARRSVASRGRAHKRTVLVGQGDAHAVDLQLGDVVDGVGKCPRLGQSLTHAFIEGPELVLVIGVVQAEHRLGVANALESVARPAADPLRRRIRRHEGRILLFELAAARASDRRIRRR